MLMACNLFPFCLSSAEYKTVSALTGLWSGHLVQRGAACALGLFRRQTLPLARPAGISQQSQGGVWVRLQGGGRAAVPCTARWWGYDDCLVLRQPDKLQTVLTVPWSTVTSAYLGPSGDAFDKNVATLLLVCQPLGETSSMLVKLYLAGYSDVECVQACLVSRGLSQTRKLWPWLGNEFFLLCGYHKIVCPLMLCDLACGAVKLLGVCTKLALGSRVLQWVAEAQVYVQLAELVDSADSSIWICGAAVAVAILWRFRVRGLLALCVVALAGGAVYLLLHLGSLRAAVAEEYPTFDALEKLVLVGHAVPPKLETLGLHINTVTALLDHGPAMGTTARTSSHLVTGGSENATVVSGCPKGVQGEAAACTAKGLSGSGSLYQHCKSLL